MADAYKQAGVDVEKGYEAVKRMRKHIAKTKRPEVLGGIGAFAGMFELTKFNYQEPVLVSGTDGVGTKLMLAFEQNKHDTVGIDLVAMCVNDIVAQGAQPLFFLDYIGCGKNNPAMIEQIVAGIATGCVQAGAALIGGETAEMPGMYQDNEYDLAGFAVGIAEKSQLITGENIKENDVLIGLASSGIHSNGYSLVRKIISENALNLETTYNGFTQTLGELLLTPTKIYAQPIKALMEKISLKGIAHITGGGFYENFPRMFPEDLGVEINLANWQTPDLFTFIQEQGNLSDKDMYGVFNMGIGMALALAEADVPEALSVLAENGEEGYVIGKVVNKKGVHLLS